MRSNFPYASIAQMGAWDFWAKPSSLQLSSDDAVVAHDRVDTAPEAVKQRIHFAAMCAARQLRDCPAGIPYGKPS